MAEIQLTPKERQALKALAHGLKPVVLLGSAGLSPAVVKEIDRALVAHELIKVKVPVDDRTEREEIFASVAESLSAARVQAIGKLLVLFRPAPEQEETPPAAPRQKGSRSMRTENRSPKAPATAPRGKVASPARAKPGRSEVEQLNRGTAPRREPGTARRAAGRTNAPKGGRGK
ncbi:MAG TPA: ribosome assembly RNA-binding protein YhbY [Burkholderiaceae bacterium]|nr:ribosome assembly RNA-binding protein YhbY [Burkholderiaceae bacterium]